MRALATWSGAIAGLLLIADGVSFVTARTALLDGFLTVDALGGLLPEVEAFEVERFRFPKIWRSWGT